MRRALSIAALLGLGACNHQPKPEIPSEPKPLVHAETSVDRAVATTGDLITYSIVVEHDASIEVQIPEAGAEIAGLRIVDLGRDPPKTDNGRVTRRRWYSLRADLVGSYVLPPLTVTFRKPAADAGTAADGEAAESELVRLHTSEIFIEVKSVLPADGEATDIRDIKPLQRRRYSPPWWTFALAGSALLLVAGIVILLLLRRRAEVVVPAPPPHEIAYAALDSLRTTDFLDSAALRRYYFALSEVLRTYVEGRFTVNATDLTSEEILPRIAALGDLPPTEQVRLRDFLAETDRVKFAAYVPAMPEVEATYEKALTFIETTETTIEATDHRPPPDEAETQA
ncbi:MAG: hypothetical protein V3T05_06750 [Myxococcota bacterium]